MLVQVLDQLDAGGLKRNEFILRDLLLDVLVVLLDD
jgi:hypothetical protein